MTRLPSCSFRVKRQQCTQFRRASSASEASSRVPSMNGIARYLLTGGLVAATMQIITGPIADWNARREGAEALKRALQPRKTEDDE
ncbi:hypothetical protein PF005_g3012 [Phytophthora fragariae]|uniref:Uncharacterized protein n=1 Tax=Phytophthora fragariae TaxID=53985 RepID=A0A6A3Z9X6_9STRA|nr:hypothetical protein PF005_g3012 [Phytophthora fragariae]KAE9253178.1 hypothetical protein PF002_g3452 [Phytophthora fragariae]